MGVRRAAMSLVGERYPDFGPMFAAQKLLEEHDLSVSRETLRKWMAEEGLWRPKGAPGGAGGCPVDSPISYSKTHLVVLIA